MNSPYNLLMLAVCTAMFLFAFQEKEPAQNADPVTAQSSIAISQNDSVAQIDSALFQLALGFMLTENYGQAEDCFRKLAEQYPGSFEVRNNQAINYALWAMSLLDASEAEEIIQYVFPFEVSYLSLSEKGSKTDLERKQKISRFIKEAVAGFEAARDLGETSPTVHLNLASAYGLAGRWEDDKKLLRKSLNEAKQAGTLAKEQDLSTTQGYALIVEGILYAYLGDVVKRDALFAQAREVYRVKAKNWRLGGFIEQNLAVAGQLDDWQPVRTAAEKYDPFLDDPEIIDGVSLRGLATLPVDREEHSLQVGKVFHKTYPESQLFVYFKDESQFMLFHQTAPAYQGTTSRQIRIGDAEARVRDQYGDPYCEQAAIGGKFILYRKAKLMFFIGADEKVQHWSTWFGKK